jgi:hypothetical protein
MSDESPASPEGSNLEIDLALSFQPAWVKEAAAPEKLARLADRYANAPESRGPRRDDRRGPRQDRRPPRDGERGPRREGGDRGKRRDGGRRDDRRDDRNGPRREEPRPDPVLAGWELTLTSHAAGVDGLARQIKSTAVAYPLFDLAQLVLEKSERYDVMLKRKDGPALFQLTTDGSVWLSEREAIAHVLAKHLDAFYRRETVEVDPPKGSYAVVAVCGLSDTLIGPPNYHDYQDRLRKLHAERYANMPFEAYKNRVRMVRDEEMIQKWKDERSKREEFVPLSTPEGEEPARLTSLADVERHFRQHHAPQAIVQAGDKITVPGPAILHSSTPSALTLARRTVDDLRRFPLPLAQPLGQALVSRGLHIFKAHENVTYVSIARPRYLDRATTPVSDALSGILTFLEEHPKTPANERRKALAAQRPLPEGENGESERDAAVTRDLSWLLHEGYVVDYARRGLEVVRRPKSRPEQPQ